MDKLLHNNHIKSRSEKICSFSADAPHSIIIKKQKFIKEQQLIYGTPTPGSLGDYWLMIDQNKRLDSDWINNYPDKWRRVSFNYQFSIFMQNHFNDLQCEFCGRNNLKIYKWFENKSDDMVTVDHFIAQSIDKNLIEDPSNLFISCYKCNNKKGEKIYDPSILKFRYEDSIRITFKFDEESFQKEKPFKI